MFRISQTEIAIRRHGRPVVQELNTYYGYYATGRFLSDLEFDRIRSGREYSGPLHEAEIRWRDAVANSCG